MVNQVWEFLKGKKTFTICAVAVVYALSAVATGHMDAQTAVQEVMAALAAASLRHGMSN